MKIRRVKILLTTAIAMICLGVVIRWWPCAGPKPKRSPQPQEPRLVEVHNPDGQIDYLWATPGDTILLGGQWLDKYDTSRWKPASAQAFVYPYQGEDQLHWQVRARQIRVNGQIVGLNISDIDIANNPTAIENLVRRHARARIISYRIHGPYRPRSTRRFFQLLQQRGPDELLLTIQCQRRKTSALPYDLRDITLIKKKMSALAITGRGTPPMLVMPTLSQFRKLKALYLPSNYFLRRSLAELKPLAKLRSLYGTCSDHPGLLVFCDTVVGSLALNRREMAHLAALQSLRHLGANIYGATTTARQLGKLPHLRSLSNELGFPIWMGGTSGFRELRTLKLRVDTSEAKQKDLWRRCARYISSRPNLRILRFSLNLVSSDDGDLNINNKFLNRITRSQPELRSLILNPDTYVSADTRIALLRKLQYLQAHVDGDALDDIGQLRALRVFSLSLIPGARSAKIAKLRKLVGLRKLLVLMVSPQSDTHNDALRAVESELIRLPELRSLTLINKAPAPATISGLAKRNRLIELIFSDRHADLTPTLAELQSMTRLRSLSIYGQLSNAQLRYLTRLKNLRGLSVGNLARIDDQGLVHLRALTSLRHLCLPCARFQGKGPGRLSDLKGFIRIPSGPT